MRDQEEEFIQRNVKVLVITFQNDFLAQCYVKDTSLTWPILIDENRAVYKSFGMLEASFWDVWGLKTWQVYFKELRKGHLPKKSEGDVYQRGGDVLIDPHGIVRLHHVGEGPADRPSVDAILSAIPTEPGL